MNNHRILRVFPRQTSMTPMDALAFVGDPPLALFRPKPEQIAEVHVSVTFTWDIEEGNRLVHAWANYYPVVRMGGPALGHCGEDFVAGRYVRHGVTFTTRGCNRNCPWCLVPGREGLLRELPDFPAGHIIQDNNILQAYRHHWELVIQMLSTQRAVTFAGGLDARLLTGQIADDLQLLRIKELFLAADCEQALPALEKALARLRELPRYKKRVYVMIAYNGESIADAQSRLEAVWQMGAIPFAQLYQPADRYLQYDQEWRTLARTWSRPAAIAAIHAATRS